MIIWTQEPKEDGQFPQNCWNLVQIHCFQRHQSSWSKTDENKWFTTRPYSFLGIKIKKFPWGIGRILKNTKNSKQTYYFHKANAKYFYMQPKELVLKHHWTVKKFVSKEKILRKLLSKICLMIHPLCMGKKYSMVEGCWFSLAS